MTCKYKGTSISPGIAEGKALVSTEPLFFSLTEVATGTIGQKGHPLYGKAAKDTVLIIPAMKANADMWKFYWCWKAGTAPKAIVTTEADDFIIAATVLAGVPCVHRLNVDLFRVFESGKAVRVNGNRGTVEILD